MTTDPLPPRHSGGPGRNTTSEPGGPRFATFVAHRPRLTLALFVLALVVAGGLGSGLFARLQSQGFSVSDSEAARASTELASEFGVHDPVVVGAVEVPAGVDDAAATRALTDLASRIGRVNGVEGVVSYWTSGKPAALRGTDGRTGQLIVSAASRDETTQAEVGSAVEDLVTSADAGDASYRAHLTGTAPVGNALNTTITADLAHAETIAVPLTFLLLLLVFGSLVSAGLPFVVAAGSVLGSFFVVWLVSLATDVSVFGLNLITGLGLGLGIDYALLVVNRFREELHGAGGDPTPGEVREAVVRTIATAGRTVVFSGATVFVVLGSMTFFQQYFLRSFGYAGMAATATAVLAALTGLPAALSVLGTRVDRFRVRRRDLAPTDEGAWAAISRFVMRRPVPVLVVALALLGTLAAPALGAAFSQVDSRVLPADAPVAVAARMLDERFTGNQGSPVEVVVPPGADDAATADYAATLSRLDHVTSVSSAQGVFVDGAGVGADPRAASFRVASGAQRLNVISDVRGAGATGSELVAAVRKTPAPVAGVLVGGAAAAFRDGQQAIADRGVLALVWVAVATIVLLFLFTGSVVIALKAVVLNLLSLSATLGVLVWVFQEGHLHWLVGDFVETGSVDTAMGVLIAITAFALSMDYEVFLLSRIVEEHRRGASTTDAVARGLQRSGRIITAAAVLLAVVFATFVTSGVTNIKQLGFGVAFAILLDATVVRGLLVPALMRLLGGANWWSPRPLTRVYERFALTES